MTQPTEQALEAMPAIDTITMEAQVYVLPPIEMPWADGTQEFPQHPAYDGYLAGFLGRMEAFMASGCPGVQFAKLIYVDLSEGYLRVETTVRIDVTAAEADTYAEALKWEETFPESDEEEPGDEHEEVESRLVFFLRNLLEKRARDNGHPIHVRLAELYGRANPHSIW